MWGFNILETLKMCPIIVLIMIGDIYRMINMELQIHQRLHRFVSELI